MINKFIDQMNVPFFPWNVAHREVSCIWKLLCLMWLMHF